MKRIHYIFISLLMLGLFSSVVTCIREKNENKHLVSDNAEIKKKHQDSIARYLGTIERLLSKDRFLVDSIQKLNKGYQKLLSKTQKLDIADSLQQEEIRKGSARYGNPAAKQFKAVLASAYGNNAFDELGVMDVRLENQMKVSTAYKGVVIHQDTIINNQTITIKQLAKNAKPNFWLRLKDWLIGMLLGGGVLLLL